jgi:hypothetical protein
MRQTARDIELQSLHGSELVSRPFAGRIGGNQQFTISRDDVGNSNGFYSMQTEFLQKGILR